MKTERDYILKFGPDLGPIKYQTYIKWKQAEAKRRERPGYLEWRRKRSAEVRRNNPSRAPSSQVKLSGKHKQRWKLYSKDYVNIENYELAKADNFKGWHCHHRLELHPDGSVRFTRKSLIDLDLYVNRPASELIFLRCSDHFKLHGVNRWE